MSETPAVLAGAVGGAVVTLLGASYGRIRGEFGGRAGRLQVVQNELKLARMEINKALESGRLWPAYHRLEPSAWRDYRAKLASQMTRGTWNQIQELAERMEVLDRQADERRATSDRLDDRFSQELQELAEEIGEATPESHGSAVAKLEDVIVGGRRGPRFALYAMIAVVLALIAGVLVLALHKPTWTSEALAGALKARAPGAQVATCDASNQFTDAYKCELAFPPCALGRVSSNAHATCSPPLEVTYDVATQGSCYVASRSTEVVNGDPPPTLREKISRLLVRFGCKQG
jgi:hypothetical protein